LTFAEIHRESESGGSRRGRKGTEDGKERKRNHVERAVVADGADLGGFVPGKKSRIQEEDGMEDGRLACI
jgi:hypothetical protein